MNQALRQNPEANNGAKTTPHPFFKPETDCGYVGTGYGGSFRVVVGLMNQIEWIGDKLVAACGCGRP